MTHPSTPAAAVSLHDLIMNLTCAMPPEYDAMPNERLARKLGHRDARHAAAELAATREAALIAQCDQLRAALPQWISIDDERKPAFRHPVLVRVEWRKLVRSDSDEDEYEHGVDVTEGEYCKATEGGSNYFESYQGTHHDSSNVTHWMELPSATLSAPAVSVEGV